MSNIDLKDRENSTGRAGGVYDDENPGWFSGSDEAKKLQNMYDAPAATKDDLPEDHPDKDNNTNQPTDDTPKAKGKTSKKRKVITGGIIGLLIGGGFGLFGLISGPLQFLHFSQILQKSQFGTNEMFGRDRSGKLIRRLTAGNSPERRNMSFLGNRVADRYQSRLRQAGLELNFQNPDGSQSRTLRSVRVDPNTSQGRSYISTLRANGVDVSSLQAVDGLLDVPLEGSGRASQGRRAVNATIDAINLNRASSAVGKRVLKIRANVSFRPLSNTARQAGENIRAFYDRRNQDVAETRRRGASAPNVRLEGEQTQTEDGEIITDEEAQRRANQGNDIGEETRTDLGRGTSRIRQNINRGGGLVGVLCLVKGIYSLSDKIQYTNVILPLMRIGVEFASLGDQVRSGDGFSQDELSRVSDLFYDEETETSVFSADSVRVAQGEEPVGNEMPDVAKPGNVGEKPEVVEAIDDSGVVSGICSNLGQIALTILGGPINIGIEILLQTLSAANVNPIDYVAEQLARVLAGEEIEGTPKGAQLGNYAMYGARLASNDAMISMGGRKLTEQEEVTLAQATEEMYRIENSQKSFALRVFNIYDVDSVASQVAINSYDYYNNTPKALSTVAQLPFTLLSSMAGAFPVEQYAEASGHNGYDYGFPRFGFSVAEMELPESYDPFENAANVEPRLESLNDKYGECFNSTINPNNGRLVTNPEGSVNYIELDEELCADADDDDLLRYRFYIADMVTVKSLACLEMISDEACKDIGMDAGTSSGAQQGAGEAIVGDPYTDGVDVACAEGTNDLGITEGYTGGRQFSIRLCSVTNIPSSGPADNAGGTWATDGAEGNAIVNSRVSGAWYALTEAARADSINLQAVSSFRSNEHQTSLYNNCLERNGGTCNSVASPGGSSHQAGVAIDFTNMSFGTEAEYGRTCSNPMTADTPEHRWMRQNAYQFGFKQLSFESWHWDALNLENRCDYQ